MASASADPYPDDGSPTKETLKNKQGLSLACFLWEVQQPKFIVVGLHGYSAHAHIEWMMHPKLTYEGSWAQKFNKAGASLCAYDHQSFGRSEGWHGYKATCQHFDDFVDDAHLVIKTVRQRTKSQGRLPLILLGMSMGGLIATRTTQTDSEGDIDALILMSPMLSLEKVKAKPINRILLPLLGAVSAVLPNLALGEKEESPFPEEREVEQNDPYFYKGRIRTRFAKENLAGVAKVEADLAKVAVPMLILVNPDDTLVEPDGAYRLHKEASSKEKTLLEFPDRWHALHHEPGNEVIFEHTIEWIKKQIGPDN
ncbi:unnamed protein product [Vitrella brassicaformis CCMP3155]|uniref:Serine aminopeptidase S33 domain-containing protein n=1 Tax=Vitrella brassicaformis (strain CCMP3155) TaxID=1169540 RepID=A0A0G4EA81_VITBC|nr:unnamed protein product [Vitrella brassicaformis CCMP3155]|mmetsp:Transcript_42030/g.104943  ORF Transcript_42030/g.104943 Transcript_42030/m.104943 type:complete len:311 (-) Transcript_42030:57-989(-)|eukprot:CEL92503.1 unnamed protein product [Vitrella brassicaformis CCMP3155]